MNNEEFINGIEHLNIIYNIDMLDKLDILTKELIEYNKHTNLTRIIEPSDIYLKHYYDSLCIVKVVDLYTINTLIDLGTGAGFPGLVLKIFYPNIKLTLLDSNNKKTKWLEYISSKLNLDIEIIHDRIENYSKSNLNKYDVVTSRAVANLRVLSELSLPLVKNNGLFIPLKANIEEELTNLEPTLKHFNTTLINKLEFKLPYELSTRNILVYKKNSISTLKDLRSYDKILKIPLKK